MSKTIQAMMLHTNPALPPLDRNWHDFISARAITEFEFPVRTADEQRAAEIACVLMIGHHYVLPFKHDSRFDDRYGKGLPPCGSGYAAICEHCFAPMPVEVGFNWAHVRICRR